MGVGVWGGLQRGAPELRDSGFSLRGSGAGREVSEQSGEAGAAVAVVPLITALSLRRAAVGNADSGVISEPRIQAAEDSNFAFSSETSDSRRFPAASVSFVRRQRGCAVQTLPLAALPGWGLLGTRRGSKPNSRSVYGKRRHS